MLRRTLRPVAHSIRSLVGTNGLSDRVLALEAATRGLASAISPPDAHVATTPVVPAVDVNILLHQSRGALLRTMPPGAQRLLSAGCAGSWYFAWIEQTYGRVREHLGIEYYSPEPDDLPDNVTWIANTASDMSGVADGSCDLVFSGENLEHLWPEEVAGFALEAARVLCPGGHLVMDSPNRLVTAPLNWSHPEHTIELTSDEACELVRLAGFDVASVQGIWLCRDPRSDAILPFDPNLPAPGWSVTERLLVARDQPDRSFIWWIQAVRSDRVPVAEAVHAFMARLFREHWPERVQRLIVPSAHGSTPSPEGDWIDVAAGYGGIAMFGPYMPLRAGRHRVTWQLQTPDRAPEAVAVCEVMIGTGAVLARHEVRPGESAVSLEFSIDETTFGFQFRCYSLGAGRFSVLRKVHLDEHLA
ncbi:MAG: methyltransferase domain-containing protein [Janthinobacterium lividum]